jgi:hypothetical protein
MNALLEQALLSVAALPEEAQEIIASLILEEIEADRRWNARFAASQDALGELARRPGGSPDHLELVNRLLTTPLRTSLVAS